MTKSITAEHFIQTSRTRKPASDNGKPVSKRLSLDRNWGASRDLNIKKSKEGENNSKLI
jgi:hypothetical protein